MQSFYLVHYIYNQENLILPRPFLRKAISLKPDHVEAHINLGTVLQKQGKLDEAERIYNDSIITRTRSSRHIFQSW